jgi:hypothetical protein
MAGSLVAGAPCKFAGAMQVLANLHGAPATLAHAGAFLTTDRIINALACLINIKSRAGVNTLRCYS